MQQNAHGHALIADAVAETLRRIGYMGDTAPVVYGAVIGYEPLHLVPSR